MIKTYPHDAGAFTQGLLYLDGHLYESTGLNGQSTIRQVNLETGEPLKKADIAKRYFGEGLVNWGDKLFSLTWRAQTGFYF